MLWKPVTSGEELFLLMHEQVHSLFSSESLAEELEFLIAPKDFVEYMKLAASIEVFMRCVRDARAILVQDEAIDSANLVRMIRQEIELPTSLRTSKKFQQLLRRVAIPEGPRMPGSIVKREALLGLAMNCYLCGCQVSVKGKGGRGVLSIEHIWPASLGGESLAENLLPSCSDCNNRKQHTFAWVTGPVLSTYQHESGTVANDLRLSLGLAKMVHHAFRGGKRLRTLREAILDCQPIHVIPVLKPNKHHFYFELLPQARQ